MYRFDAIVLASGLNIREYKITGPIEINTDHEQWRFAGAIGNQSDDLAVASGVSILGSSMRDLRLTGSGVGVVEAVDCVITAFSGLDGNYTNCIFC